MANDVGKFTMYHDYCTKSAVIHFHKRGELVWINEKTFPE